MRPSSPIITAPGCPSGARHAPVSHRSRRGSPRARAGSPAPAARRIAGSRSSSRSTRPSAGERACRSPLSGPFAAPCRAAAWCSAHDADRLPRHYAFAADSPGQWHHPSGYGTLGFALPAALGAKICDPARALLALAGEFVGCNSPERSLMTRGRGGPEPSHLLLWNNSSARQITRRHAGPRRFRCSA